MTPPAPNTILHHPHLRMIPVEGGAFIREGQEVTLSSFEMAAYPVTQALWEAVMGKGSNPSGFDGGRRPVERVSWYDAVAFCNRLNTVVNLPLCYFSDEKCTLPYALEGELTNVGPVYYRPTPSAYRLPTEAEWMYAAQGEQWGGMMLYAGSDKLNDVAWRDFNSNDEPQLVGLLNPNAFGLYDMSGNVWEWCWDLYENKQDSNIVSQIIVSRVALGGSWLSTSDFLCQIGIRNAYDSINRMPVIGFRLARNRDV